MLEVRVRLASAKVVTLMALQIVITFSVAADISEVSKAVDAIVATVAPIEQSLAAVKLTALPISYRQGEIVDKARAVITSKIARIRRLAPVLKGHPSVTSVALFNDLSSTLMRECYNANEALMDLDVANERQSELVMSWEASIRDAYGPLVSAADKFDIAAFNFYEKADAALEDCAHRE